MPQHQPHDRNTQHLAKIPLPALTRQPSVLVVQPIVLVSQVQAVFAVRVGQPASCCLFFFCCLVCFFLLLQKANQTATTKINVKFDHCYVTDRLHHVCLLFPDYIRSALPPFSAYSQTKPLWKLLLVMCHGKCAACMGCGSVSYAFFL